MNRYSVTEIIDGIRRRDNRVLRYVYKAHFPAIAKLVLTNSGTEEDAKDVFQEALIVVFRNIREKSDFELKSGFQTYIYSICRLLWLKHLRDRKNQDKNLKENHTYIEFEEPEPFREEDNRYSLYQKAFLKIPPDCQKILKMSVDGVSQKEIAETLGFKSDNYIKKRKHFCKEYLIGKIKEDPEFPGQDEQ
ncbi:MAG TPA: sigma-70 family RNA polymerase sigma factor [Bacteroidales bacterium]|nr:sigma-70 family RNA polymerase sigma factor [Bacteroidales bacterium]